MVQSYLHGCLQPQHCSFRLFIIIQLIHVLWQDMSRFLWIPDLVKHHPERVYGSQSNAIAAHCMLALHAEGLFTLKAPACSKLN
jgi:hypothetical protein